MNPSTTQYEEILLALVADLRDDLALERQKYTQETSLLQAQNSELLENLRDLLGRSAAAAHPDDLLACYHAS